MKNWLNGDLLNGSRKGGFETRPYTAAGAHCVRHCGLDPQSVAYEASLQEIAGQARNDGRGQRTQINKSTNNQINKKKKIK